MIHYLPLERIETRYTAHLDDSITRYLAKNGLDYRRYYPETGGRAESPPPLGRFLNATGTIEFKTKQVAALAVAWSEGRVQEGDTVFTSDLWHPGIEAVGYMSHFTGTKVKLHGLLWAGTFTEHDLIQPIAPWGRPYEKSILALADKIFLGSRDMKRTMRGLCNPKKLIVTGMPLDEKLDLVQPASDREPIVVWNGRMTYEKQPHLCAKLASSLSGRASVLNVTERRLPKSDYYAVLARSKVVVSFALEETFGFAVQEAVKLGCIPILPNRLCYPEQFAPEYLYDNWTECVKKVSAALRGDLPVPLVPAYDPLPIWFDKC